MTTQTKHPPRGTLAAYEGGGLTDDQAAAIEQHLSECETCREALERIRASDLDAKALREAFQDSIGELDSAVLADAESIGGDGRTAATGASLRRPLLFADSSQGKSLASADSSATGWLIPDYERIQLCGEGAYGSVWAVRDRVGVYRALKIIDLRRTGGSDVNCRESIALETYCRKVRRHPYLIQVYHVGMVGNQLYYTMELADNDATKESVTGQFPDSYRPLTLATVMARRRISPDTAIEITRRLLRGLAKLHSLDLVHRDIKPANIIIVRHMPKLADIGMVTRGGDNSERVGTPRYMPPDRVMDKTADTYALGKVLHEMIEGLGAGTFPELPARCHCRSMRWDLAKVSEVIVRACAPDAAHRYSSAAEMLEDLEACAAFSFHSLFEEADSHAEKATSESSVNAQLLLAALRAIPWVLGFAALMIILSWLR